MSPLSSFGSLVSRLLRGRRLNCLNDRASCVDTASFPHQRPKMELTVMQNRSTKTALSSEIADCFTGFVQMVLPLPLSMKRSQAPSNSTAKNTDFTVLRST
ncbi:hypothetical protein ID866_12886 [Astraeus odoratus]|nr:hypothetical protein ID866_12886 [Astraeus odoratus]